MQSGWTVRVAQESDVNDLVEMRLALHKHHECRNPSIWHALSEQHEYERLKEEIIQCLCDQDTRIFVAVDNDKLIGMVTGKVSFNEFRIPSIVASINIAFVAEEWRGKGVGTELVKKLCQFFASKGVKDVSVRYVVGNIEATRFWEKLGFLPRIITAGTDLQNLESKVQM
jgi:GNAT superfamily N-acetyltransferase